MITVDFSKTPLPLASRILDIGCGDGRHTAHASALGAHLVVGADIARKDLHAARQRLRFHEGFEPSIRGRWHLAGASVVELPFDDNAFDLVICSEVLEHIADDRRAAAELVRVLNPGGWLAVSVPRRWPEALCWLLSREYRQTPGGHVRIYPTDRLARLFARHGLRHTKTHWAHLSHQ